MTRQMPTGSIVNVESTSNARNALNGVKNAGARNVENNGKNSPFFKKQIMLAKKDELGILANPDEYDLMADITQEKKRTKD
ncbi:hypothetical protein Tco_1056423 [Tanacetum coccineum]|uniref:Uncharacterized protein n=1 Tax=Tanacetum coccineum TaxID=301880 RepID=A0ABQ5H2M3_9ASTR